MVERMLAADENIVYPESFFSTLKTTRKFVMTAEFSFSPLTGETIETPLTGPGLIIPERFKDPYMSLVVVEGCFTLSV